MSMRITVPQGRHIVAQGAAQQALGLGVPIPRAPTGRHKQICGKDAGSSMPHLRRSGFLLGAIPGFASLTPGLRYAARSGLDARTLLNIEVPIPSNVAGERSSGGAAVISLGWSVAEPQESRVAPRLNPRSGWQKARLRLCHPLRGFYGWNDVYLGLTPQANDWHPLRGLKLGMP